MIEQAKSNAIKTPGRSDVSGARSSSETIGRTLFGLYCLDAALDFHSPQDTGNVFQIVLGMFACVAFALFALNARRKKSSLSLLRRVAWLWWVYLATTPLVAAIRGYDFTHYLRIALPQFLMGTSLMMGYILLNQSKQNASLIFKGLFYSSICSSIVHLIRGLTSGYNLEDLRYYIASPLLIVMVSFGLYRLLFEGARSGLLNLAALTGGLVIVFLTVTRTYYVSIASVLLGIGLVLLRPPVWLKRRLRRRIIWNLVFMSAVLLVVTGGALVIFPDVAGHWSTRSSSLGAQDPTTLARIAEAAGEFEAMNADVSHLLIGSGIGSEHRYDERFLIGVPETTEEVANVNNYTPGHIGWVYQFYVGGLLMGWVYLFVFFIAIWKGNSPHTPYIARMAGIAVIAVFVTSTLGNMLGDRSGGLGMGFLIALALYGADSVQKAPRRRRFFVRRPSLPLSLPAPAMGGDFHAARKTWTDERASG